MWGLYVWYTHLIIYKYYVAKRIARKINGMEIETLKEPLTVSLHNARVEWYSCKMEYHKERRIFKSKKLFHLFDMLWILWQTPYSFLNVYIFTVVGEFLLLSMTFHTHKFMLYTLLL